MLVTERGLKNTRRNRRWLAFLQILRECGLPQDQAENLAWILINVWEATS